MAALARDRRGSDADPVGAVALSRSRAGQQKPAASYEDEARGEYEHSRCFVQFRRTHCWSSPLAQSELVPTERWPREEYSVEYVVILPHNVGLRGQEGTFVAFSGL